MKTMRYMVIRQNATVVAVTYDAKLYASAVNDVPPDTCQVWAVNAISPTAAIDVWMESMRSDACVQYFNALQLIQGSGILSSKEASAADSEAAMRRTLIVNALTINNGHIINAARHLQVHRKTLWRWMNELGIENGGNGHTKPKEVVTNER